MPKEMKKETKDKCQFKKGSFERWLCANKLWCKLCPKK